MSANVKFLVCGAAGKMGRQIVALASRTDGLVVAAAVDAPGSPALGKDAGETAGIARLGVAIGADIAKALAAADVAIDFSHPSATLAVAEACARAKKPLVIGTTGHDGALREKILGALRPIPCVWAPNTAVGVNVLFTLAAQAARILGEEFDIEIVEMHHRAKRDAPSGTALRLAEETARARGKDLKKDGVFTRHGDTGERARGSIGVQTLRGGDVVGDHSVLFAADGEVLTLSHRATSRENFARGALLAARWLSGKPAGLYGMADVLGLPKL